MTFKEALIQFEIEHEMNHEMMAQKIGVSLSTYYRWISGETTQLRVSTKKKVSELLQMNVDDILEESHRFKPILGEAKAGYNLPAEQRIEGYMEVSTVDAHKGDYFLRVQGDSMEGAHIYDGDLIYVQTCHEVRDGQIAVVLIDDEATIKKVRYKNELMILEAANPKYEPRFFTPQEIEELPVRIIGLVRFVRTDFV